MNEIGYGIINGIKLLISFNKDIYEIIGLSLFVSIFSTIISSAVAIPSGIIIGLKRFRGRDMLIRIINTLMGLPPVLAGLFVYLLLSRKGPFGQAGLLFTPTAMIIAQMLLIIPIVCGMVINITIAKGRVIYEALFTLNANKKDILFYIIRESRFQILGAVTAGFGRAISEVGAIMLVGGNIEHRTRVMTTFIVLQTGMGKFDRAIAIGFVLLLIAFIINYFISRLSKEN